MVMISRLLIVIVIIICVARKRGLLIAREQLVEQAGENPLENFVKREEQATEASNKTGT